MSKTDMIDRSGLTRRGRRIPYVVSLLVVPLMQTGCASGPGMARPQLLTLRERELNVESFDYVWKTIADHHWDPNLGGVDWEAAKEELRPRVAEAETMPQARAVMDDLIGRLGQSHFAIIPAGVYKEMDAATENGPAHDADEKTEKRGRAGIEVRVVDGQALVFRVYPDSPADTAGVRPGWIIERVRDKDIAPVVDRVSKAYADDTLREFLLARAVASRMAGNIGDKMTLQLLNGSDELVSVELTLGEPRGHAARLGFMPEMHVWFESRLIEDGPRPIGYIAFNAFFDLPRIMDLYGKAVQQYLDAPGLIIDLRGNPGGLGVMAMGMAGWLIEEENQYLGRMHLRETDLRFVVNPRLDTYKGPVAVLVDGLSASTAEIFAAGLQDLGRARVFGTRTAAAALPSQFERLPNGDGFQYAMASYESASGTMLEGNGVMPDVEVELSREALLAGHDPVIEAALEWIAAESASQAHAHL